MALSADLIWEFEATASNNNGGGTRWVSLVNATYKWTASGSGTNEYYVELAGGGDPGLTEPNNVTTDGTYEIDTNGAMGSLNAGEWDWGDNDALGYSTVYVRLDDDADPDNKNTDFVSMVFDGGIDYSRQDGAQLNPTDLAMVQASTTLTSVTGGFTAAMVGNLINITAGVNFDTGRYEITVYTDTNTVTLDRTAASGGNGSSGTGYIGGALALPVDAILEAFIPGNTAYMEAGTYTLTGAVDVALDGTAQDPIAITGYNATRGDNPTGDDRPLIAAAANTFNFDNYWLFNYIRHTTTTSQGFRADVGSQFRNCKSQNSSGAAARFAFYTGGTSKHLYSEAISDNGLGIYARNASTHTYGCYIHDSVDGFFTPLGGTCLISNCLIDTCSGSGINFGSRDDEIIINNTIYNCGIGIEATDGHSNIILNNIIDSCTTGASWDTEQGTNFFDYNDWFNNGTDVVNVTKGDNALAVDPQFTDAPNGDFSIALNLRAAGFPGEFPGGLSTGYLDVGAVQRQEAGGIAGARRHNV